MSLIMTFSTVAIAIICHEQNPRYKWGWIILILIAHLSTGLPTIRTLNTWEFKVNWSAATVQLSRYVTYENGSREFRLFLPADMAAYWTMKKRLDRGSAHKKYGNREAAIKEHRNWEFGQEKRGNRESVHKRHENQEAGPENRADQEIDPENRADRESDLKKRADREDGQENRADQESGPKKYVDQEPDLEKRADWETRQEQRPDADRRSWRIP